MKLLESSLWQDFITQLHGLVPCLLAPFSPSPLVSYPFTAELFTKSLFLFGRINASLSKSIYLRLRDALVELARCSPQLLAPVCRV